MSVPFEALKVGQRYSFTELATRKVNIGVLKKKYVVRGEESLSFTLDASGDQPSLKVCGPYSFFNIESLGGEKRGRKEGEEREIEMTGSGPVGKILEYAGLPQPNPGKGGKRKTRKSKKRSRKTRRR
jgi:hypothetical protein